MKIDVEPFSRIQLVSPDSIIIKVHPDGTAPLRKKDPKPSVSPAATGAGKFP